MDESKKDGIKDDRVHIRMSKNLKIHAQIRALELGYDKAKGGFSQYIIDLIKKDGVKEE